MAETVGRPSRRWIVAYDADCGFCMWLLSGLLRWDGDRSLRSMPIQGAEAGDLLADLDAGRADGLLAPDLPRWGAHARAATRSRHC